VKPLLPPQGSVLLVTSRNKFALPGLREKNLDVLTLGDAKKVLLEIAGRIGENDEVLAKLCGCLPQALRNAAYALKEMPNLSVANYIKKLGDAKKRLKLVEASFDLSYQLLPEELKGLWCLLSVFTADFDQSGAEGVWEMEQAPTEDALGELVKWSLVDFLPFATGEGGRYRLHDLARDFADSRQKADAREFAQQRHAKHYLEFLWKASELFLQGGDGFSRGLALFDADWKNIQAGQKWAKTSAAKSFEIAEICSKFAETGSILGLRLHPHDNIEWLAAALASARLTKSRNAEGNHLGNMGLAYYNLGETRKAIECYEQALKISREIGDRRGEGNQLGNMGNAYYHLGETGKVIEYHELALKIAREIGDRRGEGADLSSLGSAYLYLGETGKAIEYYEKALKIARKIGDRRGEGSQLGNMGSAYSHLGEMKKAIEHYEQALNISREIGDRRGEGNDLGNMGSAYYNQGEMGKAIEYYEQALNISREIGDRRGEGNHLFNKSLSLYRLDQKEEAIKLAREALSIFEQIESPNAKTALEQIKTWER
jgi:tetratricopeptide (TPR) repeat protein